MRDWRVAIDVVGASPKEQVAWFEIIKFK